MWGEAKRDLASVDSKKPKGEVVASLPSYRKIESLDLLALLMGSGGKTTTTDWRPTWGLNQNHALARQKSGF